MKPAYQRNPMRGFAALFTLVICAATLAVPGCSRTKPTRSETIDRYSQELREVVSADVPDERRKAQMLAVVDQLEALHRRFSAETLSFIERFHTMNADYDAPRPAFDQLFSDYKAQRIKARSEGLDLHFQLASLATADEWGAIRKAEMKLYEKATAMRPVEQDKK